MIFKRVGIGLLNMGIGCFIVVGSLTMLPVGVTEVFKDINIITNKHN